MLASFWQQEKGMSLRLEADPKTAVKKMVNSLEMIVVTTRHTRELEDDTTTGAQVY